MKAALPIFAATLALVTSTGLAGRSLLAPAPAPSPIGCQTIAQVAAANGLTTLLAAVDAAGLTSVLSDPATADTIFAPTDSAWVDAFYALNVTQEQVLGDKEVLTAFLQNHILSYPLTAADLLSKKTVVTDFNFPNSPLNITAIGDAVQIQTPVDAARVEIANVQACQSIVHIIDAVLIPVL